MNIQDLYDFCEAKKGVTQHFPFDQDTLVFKVGGKIFCLTSLDSWEKATPSINLKCDPEKAMELRANHQGIKPGYHMNKKHWNTVMVNQEVSNQLLITLIDHSYQLVFDSLPQKIKKEL
ncbi:MmcQ-like protein [Flavobacterium branchiophilum]|uniref:Putative DNA-binding protein (MmcQ/YjbR family) n=1 Tax=Flavobacterium branchiophilum TaxID=55197 RepID=A0A543G651_9FLAO|nr:MmcQ/YjbR family DNA-binding protein [Flavobacterium branchiophilum]OXA81133.1 MmcQ-like protein [Flavobacterium branchiophilum] [Flavobacterium branchiophilum NBRC 15030 = ATCC 35035]TQM41560.1 putative DNA-binding protein (MmcQ/YjbR family) [Flavobacterium branchiophilum]GEM55144.1 hypothetical protein FB1_13650 [Flavobacterium branchiophilum NBRC 15030 = ATCC 35035]